MRKHIRLVSRCVWQSQDVSFRIIHFSLQRDHLHLILEAKDSKSLANGMRALNGRIARRLNQTLLTRGPVVADRFHVHTLKTPRETGNAIHYVLHNLQHHDPTATRLDPCSSLVERWAVFPHSTWLIHHAPHTCPRPPSPHPAASPPPPPPALRRKRPPEAPESRAAAGRRAQRAHP